MKTENLNDTRRVSVSTKIGSPGADVKSPEECALMVENMIGGYSREFILYVLLTVTVNAIHVIDDRAIRRRTEQEYIKALQFLSAIEEQYQPEDVTDPPSWADECVAKMMRHVFRAIGAE